MNNNVSNNHNNIIFINNINNNMNNIVYILISQIYYFNIINI